jgi:AcrR family transcriptional regulator
MSTSAGDQRRAEILDAVVGVIIDVGFTEMTVADVAKRAGVSTALVHYHFSSKAELIAAALRVASEDDKHFRDGIVAGPGSATARLDRLMCESLPSDASDASWLLWIETWGETRRNSEIREVMSDLDAHEIATIMDLIASGEQANEFTCPDPAAVAARLTALRDGLAIDRTLFHEDLASEVLRKQLSGSVQYNLGLTSQQFSALLDSPA